MNELRRAQSHSCTAFAKALALGSVLLFAHILPAEQVVPKPITDKTLVAWVYLANTTQKGGSALTLDNQAGAFDAIVFGEIGLARWMAGSDFHRRTDRNQDAYPTETLAPDTLVQVAIVYRGKEITVYRNGRQYARHRVAQPQSFGADSAVVMGLRHLEAGDRACLVGAIEDARIYDAPLTAETIAALRPNQPSDPKPIAWWSFEDGKTSDQMGTFPSSHLFGSARIADGKLHLPGGEAYLVAASQSFRTRQTEDWPVWHVTALPDEGVCLPYDANGCIYWKGKYHLMYIFQDPKRPQGGHCWGHLSSTDLVNWTYHPPTVVPDPGDPDIGIFSGNAFVNKDGVPMLCWFGINAGVCVATAQDDDLIRWKKHPRNPIIPIPKPGQDAYKVWDPYLWLEGDTYYCLLGGNQLPNKKDTLYLCKSSDMVTWTPLHPFYEHPDLSWTTEGEDCSCPDFFKLGDKHVLLCISHKVGARCYVGRFDKEKEKFFPEQHVRMNWPGGTFFAPESLLDHQGRRVFWAWVTDPRTRPTQRATGSGVQSMPRILSLAKDGTVRITPAPELEALRKNHRTIAAADIPSDGEIALPDIRGDCMELAVEIQPGQAREVGLKVRCSPDGKEETAIWYSPSARKLTIDMSQSTLRKDVRYCSGPIDGYFGDKDPRGTVEAPLDLPPGEPLRLRVFLDKPMLEVFANDRQCVTQQIFPLGKEALLVKACARGGPAKLHTGEAWDMAAATFVNHKTEPAATSRQNVIFEDRFDGKLLEGWKWLRENPGKWRIKDAALEIQVEPGLAETVKNALVRTAPDRSKGKVAIDVTVSFTTPPTSQYEQAGITWYKQGKPALKLVHEHIDGKTWIIPGRIPTTGQPMQLRLLVSADQFTAQFRPDGKGEFQTAASGPLPPGTQEEVSIQCYNGPKDAEHWMRFDDFRITNVPD